MIDWRSNGELLYKESERLFRALFSHHEKSREPLAAIGYVFEFGSGQICFDLCANTVRNAHTSLTEFLAKYPDASPDEFRWNSGDYDYSVGADQYGGGWSQAWWDEIVRLDQLTNIDGEAKEIYDGIGRICCNVLAKLALSGVLGDWRKLDFNVATLLDEIPEVKERDRQIRQLIESSV